MRKILFSIILLFFVLQASCSIPLHNTKKDVVVVPLMQRMLRSAVSVTIGNTGKSQQEEIVIKKPQNPRKRENKGGSGSGVILDASCHIITNAHVVGDKGINPHVVIEFFNKQRVPGTVIGHDVGRDLALIKLPNRYIDFCKKNHAVFGNSDEVRVGDFVIAVGTPFGFDRTMTRGIISHLKRKSSTNPKSPLVLFGKNLKNLFQTDAAINPGNSGGALFDDNGGLIGINQTIYTVSGASHSIGFAIRSNDVKDFYLNGISGDTNIKELPKYPWIGIGFISLEATISLEEFIEKYQDHACITLNSFVVVGEPSGPALEYGIKIGDIICRVDGRYFFDRHDFTDHVKSLSIGEKITLQIVRDDAPLLSVIITLGERPIETMEVSKAEPSVWLGIGFTALGLEQNKKVFEKALKSFPLMKKYYLFIDRIIPGSPAEQTLKVGDIIIMYDGKSTENQKLFVEYIKSKKPGDRINFQILRGDKMLLKTVTLMSKIPKQSRK